jgi:hypothetical protein
MVIGNLLHMLISRGLFHTKRNDTERKALYQFLLPWNPLVGKLLSIQTTDRNACFSISPEYLSLSTQIKLQQQKPTGLPKIYQKRIKSGQPQRITFNLFEYYMFCFSLSATFVKDSNDIGARKMANDIGARKMALAPGMQSGSMVLDQTYFDLVDVYLKFFLPQKPAPITTNIPHTPVKGKSSLATSLKQPPALAPASPAQYPLDNSSIFRCTFCEKVQDAAETASFTIESMIETWLCQNIYEPELGKGDDVFTKTFTFIKPNSYQLDCISKLVEHIVSLDLSFISSEQLLLVYCDRTSGQLDKVYDINKANVYKCFAPNFYRFLSLALQHWPRDESVIRIIEIWLHYAFPWKTFGFQEKYIGFVMENYLFYTRILQLFLARGLLFDFYASVRPSPHTTQPQKSDSRYLSISEKVFGLFNDEKLIELLQALEKSLLSLKNYASTSPLMRTTTTVSAKMPTATSSKGFKSDIGYKYRNSGPDTRLHVINFEGSFVYKPIFQIDETDNSQMSKLPQRFVNVVWEAKERLDHYKMKKSKSLGSSSPSTTIYNTLMMFIPSSGSVVKPLTVDQITVIEKNMERLNSLIASVSRIWVIPNRDNEIKPMRRTQSDLTGLLYDDDDEGVLNEWAPGVFEPQRAKEVGNVLTLRGRNQVKWFFNLLD